jgi:hypothetical protein
MDGRSMLAKTSEAAPQLAASSPKADAASAAKRPGPRPKTSFPKKK